MTWDDRLEQGDVLTAKQGAQLMGVSVSTFYRAFGRYAIRHAGMRHRWLRSDLLEALLAHRSLLRSPKPEGSKR